MQSRGQTLSEYDCRHNVKDCCDFFHCARCFETYLCSCFAGGAPLVVARGGFSGMFPDSSDSAYNLAVITCGPDVYVWCDVQLTKDGVGICQPDINLLNSTYIAFAYPNKTTSYLVNGVPTTGYFSLDYTFKQLSSVVCEFNLFKTRSFIVNSYIFFIFDELSDSFIR